MDKIIKIVGFFGVPAISVDYFYFSIPRHRFNLFFAEINRYIPYISALTAKSKILGRERDLIDINFAVADFLGINATSEYHDDKIKSVDDIKKIIDKKDFTKYREYNVDGDAWHVVEYIGDDRLADKEHIYKSIIEIYEPDNFNFDIKDIIKGDEVEVIQPQGALFFGSIDKFKNFLSDVKANGKNLKHIIFDMKGVFFIDASGLYEIEKLYLEAKERNIEVHFCNLTKQPKKSILKSHIISILKDGDIQNDVDAVIRHLKQEHSHSTPTKVGGI